MSPTVFGGLGIHRRQCVGESEPITVSRPFIRSVDGGRTWEGRAMQSRLASNLIDVYFKKTNWKGYATGGTDGLQSGTAVILRTLDGGGHLGKGLCLISYARYTSRMGLENLFPFEGCRICFRSSTTVVVSPTAKVLKTEDGGATWRETVDRRKCLKMLDFRESDSINETTGWASGRGGHVRDN